MPVHLNGPNIEWHGGQAPGILSLAEIAPLRDRHLQHVLGTLELEVFARYRLLPLTEASFSMFLHHVFMWGGMQYGPGDVMDAPWAERQQQFLAAVASVGHGDLAGACNQLDALPGLGISYATKLLRFISPEKCAILDSNVRIAFGYDETAEAFSLYSGHCHEIAQALLPYGLLLRPADIDMALFAYLSHW
jgi:hypothetical protein